MKDVELLTVTERGKVGGSKYTTKAEVWVSLYIPQPI